jgi:hypothetical protein
MIVSSPLPNSERFSSPSVPSPRKHSFLRMIVSSPLPVRERLSSPSVPSPRKHSFLRMIVSSPLPTETPSRICYLPKLSPSEFVVPPEFVTSRNSLPNLLCLPNLLPPEIPSRICCATRPSCRTSQFPPWSSTPNSIRHTPQALRPLAPGLLARPAPVVAGLCARKLGPPDPRTGATPVSSGAWRLTQMTAPPVRATPLGFPTARKRPARPPAANRHPVGVPRTAEDRRQRRAV